jgi:hypothetical protein
MTWLIRRQAERRRSRYVGGFTVRTVRRHQRGDYRIQLSQQLRAVGDVARHVFQNDNDDPPACRVSWVMDTPISASLMDGKARSRPTARSVDSRRRVRRTILEAPNRRRSAAAHQRAMCSTKRCARPGWEGTFFAAMLVVTVFAYKPQRQGAGFDPSEDLPDVESQTRIRRVRLRDGDHWCDPRHRDGSGRPTSRLADGALTSATGSTRASAVTRISTTLSGAITGSRRRLRRPSPRRCPTIEGSHSPADRGRQRARH